MSKSVPGRRSWLLRLLLLPLRPGFRWLTLMFLLLFAAAWWTGYLDLGGRYVWWRFWPLSTPLVGVAAANSQAVALLDMTRPGTGRLAPLAETEQARRLAESLALRFDINPKRDLLQAMFAFSPSEGPLRVYSGRFRMTQVGEALQAQGAQQLALPDNNGGPATQHWAKPGQDAGAEEWLLYHDRFVLAGPRAAIMGGLARLRGEQPSFAEQPQLAHGLNQLGIRHLVTLLWFGGGDRQAFSMVMDPAPAEGAKTLLWRVWSQQESPEAAAASARQVGQVLDASQGLTGLLLSANQRRLLQGAKARSQASELFVEGEAQVQDLRALLQQVQNQDAMVRMAGAVGVAALLGPWVKALSGL